MDLVREQASVIVEEKEDRISNLADDIIHHILSFLDMKYAVQTCTLSKKWKHIWTLMPHLNFNSPLYPSLLHFAKFVKHALVRRNNRTDVSAVDLKFTGSAKQFVIKSIVNYAFLHNVRELKLTLFSEQVSEFPQQFFSSHTLKHLSLEVHHLFRYYCLIRNLAWDFPVLETLNMKNLQLRDDNDKNLNLFSKCVNLKELTLHDCSACGDLGIFNICAPKLSSLTITGKTNFSQVFNVVSSHLENLTLTITSTSRFNFLEMSPEGLNKVNLSLPLLRYATEKYMSALLDLFPKLHGAKYLILDWRTMETFSSCLNQLSHEPCPFDNLKCLRINARHLKQKQKMPTQVKNYFLENSPNATFIVDLHQVPQKRSMVNNDGGKSQRDTIAQVISEQQVPQKRSLDSVRNEATTANKVAKLDKMKAMFEAKVEMQDKLIAEQKAKLQMQDEVVAQQKEMFEAKIVMQDRVIAEQEARIQMQNAVDAKQKVMFETKIQMQDEVNTKQKEMFEAKIQMQDGVIAEQKEKVQMLEVTMLQNEKLMSHIIKSKITELKVQVESGNPSNPCNRV